MFAHHKQTAKSSTVSPFDFEETKSASTAAGILQNIPFISDLPVDLSVASMSGKEGSIELWVTQFNTVP